MTNSIDDLLSGGGKTAKFPVVGTTYQGTVVSAEPRQSTNFDTGKPEFWEDGKPRMQIVIALETAERLDAEDDGVRSVYIKAFGDQRKALQAAAKAAGGSPAKGDFFKVTYVGDGEKPARGYAPKIYAYEIRKANPIDAALNEPVQQYAQQAPQQFQQAPQYGQQAPQFQQAAPIQQAAPVQQFQQAQEQFAQFQQAPVAPQAAPVQLETLSPQQEAQVAELISKSLTDEQIARVVEGVRESDAAGIRMQLAATGTNAGF